MAEDEDTNKLKRAASELGIDIIDIREGDEAELFQHCGLQNTIRARGKLRRLVRAHQNPVFRVSARIRGALRSSGARGNVYKTLEAYDGYFHEGEGRLIAYNEDDLHIKAYFFERRQASGFQSALNQWEIHKELALLDGIELNPPNPEPVIMTDTEKLSRFYLQQYNPHETESPCQSLNQLASYGLSVPVTEGIELTDPLAVFQSLDVCLGTNKPYKCHLKDKALFKAIQNNPNNMVAASWPLHQMLDGLNNQDGMPVMKLSTVNSSPERIQEKDRRFSVTLQLEFYHVVDAESFQARVGSKRVDKQTWQTVVYVEDKEKFIECVEWKGNATQRIWDAHRAALNAM